MNTTTPFDNASMTMAVDCPRLLIPLANESLIPFHIFVYENSFLLYNENNKKLEELKAIYQDIVDRLEALALAGELDEHTRHCNTPLKDIKLKDDVLLVSITRGSKTEIPGGLSTFGKGDTIVVVTSRIGSIRQLNDIFA